MNDSDITIAHKKCAGCSNQTPIIYSVDEFNKTMKENDLYKEVMGCQQYEMGDHKECLNFTKHTFVEYGNSELFDDSELKF